MDLIVNVELLYVLQCVQGKIFNYVEEFLIHSIQFYLENQTRWVAEVESCSFLS